MNWRPSPVLGLPAESGWASLVSVIGSMTMATLLLVAFCFWTKVDLAHTVRLLSRLPPADAVEIVLLMGFNSFLSGEKWRLVALRPRDLGIGEPPHHLCFALSAIGAALGQFLPSQISTVLARSVGARAYGGRVLRDGIGATVVEQLFDVFVAGLLGSASVMVIIASGTVAEWMLWSLTAIVIGLGICGSAGRVAAHGSGRLASLAARIRSDRLRALVESVGQSRLMAPALTFPLFALSILRFTVLVLIGMTSANALSLQIPLWHLAAAFPFAILAVALALTPAALGVTEWAFSSVLVALGTSFQAAGQWAVGTRILVTVAAGLMGLLGILIVGVSRWCRLREGSF